MKKVYHIKSQHLITNDEIFDLKDMCDTFLVTHNTLSKKFQKEIENIKHQLEKDKWEIIHRTQKVADIIFEIIDAKSWYLVEHNNNSLECKKFYFFPYRFNYNSNNIIAGLYVPIDDNYNCGINDKIFYLKNFLYNDSKWTKVSEKQIVKYIKNNLQKVINYRKERLK